MEKANLPALSMMFICILASPLNVFAKDWTYTFVVWDNSIYVITEEIVTNIEKEIGEVTKYSDLEQYRGNFSNIFPKGTKYYLINGVDTNIALAIQKSDGKYVKAYRKGKYEYPYYYSEIIYTGIGIVTLLIIGFVIFINIKK